MDFSLKQLATFAAVFALVGGYALWYALAAPNPNLKGDLNNDNTVNVTDLSILLSYWNTNNPAADINADNTVNITDLSILLSYWGQSVSTYTVTQSIAGGQTLSGNVSWTATPSDVANTTKVEFYIDGVLKWTELTTPYVYNGDGNALDTTTLTNASHTFMAKAYKNDGTSTNTSANATVNNSAGSTIPAGRILMAEYTAPSTDAYTNSPTTADKQWMNTHWYRAIVYGGYWDSRYSWYNKTWTYVDAYALYNPSTQATQHPDWILKDASGNKLYIPYACNGTSCTQYAADIGNPTVQQYYIDQAKAARALGSLGIHFDDVNLQALQVGNGSGALVAPIDPRTGTTMTYTAWKNYFASFMENARNQLPGAEILHNAVWFAAGGNTTGVSDPYVIREVKAANVIEMERGMCDTGLTGGTGQWSIYSYFRYADSVHANGAHVLLNGSGCSSLTQQQYNITGYLMFNNGGDTVTNVSTTGLPANWWPGNDMNLGDALGARTRDSTGLYRRDFTQGVALLVEPGAATRTINLGSTYYNAAGQAVTSVTLGGSQGAVLRK